MSSSQARFYPQRRTPPILTSGFRYCRNPKNIPVTYHKYCKATKDVVFRRCRVQVREGTTAILTSAVTERLIPNTILAKWQKCCKSTEAVVYNSILRLCYFPVKWKYAQIIMIAKPGRPPTETNSYRPISLLPTLSKVFEQLILKRLEETVPINIIIPMH
jgi:hypothetical protein